MGEAYERELERVQRARADFEASQDEVELRKQEYFTAVRTLHEAGMPLREIATALGLSHQRVHQMVDEATGRKGAALRRQVARTAKQGGLATLVMLLAVSGFLTLRPDLSPLRDKGAIQTAVSQAPSPSQSLGEDTDVRRAHEFNMGQCAKRIFITLDRFEGSGHGPKVFFKRGCGVLRLQHEVETKADHLRSRVRELTITIDKKRA